MSSLTVILDSELKEIPAKEQKSNQTKISLTNIPQLSFTDTVKWASYEHTNDLIQGPTDNHLINAFLSAYNRHLPLVLRPDDIHMAIQMAIAVFINNNPERYRDLFVAHAGQKELSITSDFFDISWVTKSFAALIQKDMKNPQFIGTFTYKYSTTTPLIHAVSNLTLMNTVKAYFAYEWICACGIPSVQLMGSKEDWAALKTNYEFLKTFLKDSELQSWFPHFDTLMNLFVDMRNLGESGQVSASKDMQELWKRVISLVPQGSGGDTCLGGWIRLLFPYTSGNRLISGLHNPVACLDIKEKDPSVSEKDRYTAQHKMKQFYIAQGWSSIPPSVLRTPLKLVDMNGTSYDSQVSSGFFPSSIVDGQVRSNFGLSITNPTPEKISEQGAESFQ